MVVLDWIFSERSELSSVKKELRLLARYIGDFSIVSRNTGEWIHLWNYGRLNKLRKSVYAVKKAIYDEEHILEKAEEIRRGISRFEVDESEQQELFELHRILQQLHENLDKQLKLFGECKTNWAVLKKRKELLELMEEQRSLLFGPQGEQQLLTKFRKKASRHDSIRQIKKSILLRLQSIQEGFYDLLYPRVKDGFLTPYALERPKPLLVEDPFSGNFIQGEFVIDQELRPHINDRFSFKEKFDRFMRYNKSKIDIAVGKYVAENDIKDKSSAIKALIRSYSEYNILKDRKNALLLSAVRVRYLISVNEASLRSAVRKRVNSFIFEVPDSRKRFRIGLGVGEYQNQKKTVDYLLNEYDLYTDFLEAHKKVWVAFLRWYSDKKINDTLITNITTNMAAFATSNVLFKKMIMGKDLSEGELMTAMLIGLMYALQTPYLYRLIDKAIPIDTYRSQLEKHLKFLGRTTLERFSQLPLQVQHYCFLIFKNSKFDIKGFIEQGWKEGTIKGAVSWAGYLPVGFGVNYIIQNKVPLKFRYLAAASWNVVFGIAAEIIAKL
ncbi:MAG: hypothetical protein KKC75_01525 [Nanoarchaeota archaeon]|nr:hypothetical protein [Nanoarchaeota archaeon]MBU1004367.1 hypothetical protein [Nanoarchaeota archaeon]MBU1946746.1 hypothetical protein [Nanoarchaeota archaeon]